MKLIIDAETGTVLNLENCFIVDDNDLSNEDIENLDMGNDSLIAEIAVRLGTPVQDSSTGN